MTELRNLFNSSNGVGIDKVKVSPRKTTEKPLALFRPSKSLLNIISGYISRNEISPQKIFPKNTLFVSTNGQGSHTYSYISPCEFVPNSDIMVLEPKDNKMSYQQKMFYAQSITANRYKYSYGRKPKGDRLLDLLIPSIEEIPEWVTNKNRDVGKIITIEEDKLVKPKEYEEKIVPLSDLFISCNGLSSSQVIRVNKQKSKDYVPYIRPSNTQRTSIDKFVNTKEIDEKYIHDKGTLYVSSDGQGSHTYSYVSTFKFIPNSNVTVLKSKRAMKLQEKLFYAMIITKNRYKFSYGRKPKGNRLLDILVPKYPPIWIYNKNFFEDILK